jgi:hypothetical protein
MQSFSRREWIAIEWAAMALLLALAISGEEEDFAPVV